MTLPTRRGRGWVTVRTQPRLCHHERVLKPGVMVFCHRECSAQALQARIGVRAGVLRRLSQSFASGRQMQCAGVMPGILLEPQSVRIFFLRRCRCMWGGPGWRSSSIHVSRTNPSDAEGSEFRSSLRGSVATSPTTEREACAMQWWPVPVRRCGWAADDTGLTGVSLSIGQGVDSSALRASEVQIQLWQEAKLSCLQVAGLTEGTRLAFARYAQ